MSHCDAFSFPEGSSLRYNVSSACNTNSSEGFSIPRLPGFGQAVEFESGIWYPEDVTGDLEHFWQRGDDFFVGRLSYCRDPENSVVTEMAYRAQKVQKVMVQPIVSLQTTRREGERDNQLGMCSK